MKKQEIIGKVFKCVHELGEVNRALGLLDLKIMLKENVPNDLKGFLEKNIKNADKLISESKRIRKEIEKELKTILENNIKDSESSTNN